MRTYPRLSVVILNHNGFQHTRECLESIRRASYKPLSVIVVDSASTDDSVKKLKDVLCQEELIELSVNGGYTYGNNIAIEYSFKNKAEYALILNNDTVMDKNCIESLVEAVLSDPAIGIIGPKVLYYSRPEIISFAGITGCIHSASYTRIGLNEKDTGQYDNLVDTLYQDGCALLITKACYERIGGFDELLWTYSEESDLCMRARLGGFRVCCLQKSKIWHKVSGTLGTYYERKPQAVYYGVRNSYIFHRRYAGSCFNRIMVVLILLSRKPREIASIMFKAKKTRLKNLWMLIIATLVGIITNIRQPSDAFAPVKAVRRNLSY